MTREVLGRCPDCDATVPRARLLIEYETTDGDTAVFAECPVCESVSHPLETT